MTDTNVLVLAEKVAKLERQVAFLLEKLNMNYVDDPSTAASAAVLNLVKQGNLIEAMKVYREETGAGLAVAKQFIETLPR